MWRLIPLVIVPVSMLAQALPFSLLRIEEEPGTQVVRLRNLSGTDITSYVVGYGAGRGHLSWTRWDIVLQPSSELFPAGATRSIGGLAQEGPSNPNDWKVFAVLYADGTFWGDVELLKGELEDREAITRQIAKAREILAANVNPVAAIESWLVETRKSRLRGTSKALRTSGRVLPIMAELIVPNYVKRQLGNGLSAREIIETLNAWEGRLLKYKLDVTFV
jgi:hypothetical protein